MSSYLLTNMVFQASEIVFGPDWPFASAFSPGKIGRRSLTAQHLQRLATGFGQIHRPLDSKSCWPSLDFSKVFMACFPSYEVG